MNEGGAASHGTSATAVESGLWTDQSFLRGEQYADSANLRARQAIYGHQVPRRDIAAWVLGLLGLDGDEVVADVGCGNGAYLSALAKSHRGTVVGLDLSLGMLRDARGRLRGEACPADPQVDMVQGDAERLPFRSASSDVVLAMHMLYHVPDRRASLREFRRVLRVGGRIAVVLNSSDHLAELRQVLDEAFGDLGLPVRFPVIGSLRLDEGAALMSELFGPVSEHRADSELRITDPEAVVRYAQSLNVTRSVRVDPDRLAAEIRDKVRRLIEAHGAFRVRAAPGCLIASA